MKVSKMSWRLLGVVAGLLMAAPAQAQYVASAVAHTDGSMQASLVSGYDHGCDSACDGGCGNGCDDGCGHGCDNACGDGCCEPACGCEPSCGCEGDCGGCCSKCCCKTGGYVAGAELLFLDVFAKAGAGGGPNDATPDFDYEAAYRLWIGYEGADGVGARFRYFDFDQDASATVGIVSVTEAIEIQNYDFEATVDGDCCGFDLTFAAGVRWTEMNIDRNLAVLGVPVLDINSAFDGAGPTLALEARRNVSANLTFFAGARWSVLMGDSDAALAVLGVPVAAITQNDVFIDTMEVSIGGEYTRCMGGGSIGYARAAWEYQYYGIHTTLLDGGEGDIVLSGPAFAVGVRR